MKGTRAIRKQKTHSISRIHPTSNQPPFCTLVRCNKHLLGLGQQIKQSLTDAGLIGYQFGTVGVSDGISMGTSGMSYSLQSRDLIADQVETAAGGHWLDGMVVVPGCDKNMPGVLMACRSRFQKLSPSFIKLKLMTLFFFLSSGKAEPSWFNGLWWDNPSWFLR